jgi:PPM family protein phosphatase
VFAVADGVGGAQAGEVASQMAVEILGEAFINMNANADPEETMRIALDRANEAIFQMSHDLPQLSSMATTIAALHVNGDIATIAHVGDSRVYRMDGHGRLFRETGDHSIVEEEVRAGRMTPAQALTHPSRNVISRALGAEHTVDPDIKLVLVYPGTRFLLCSDGITRHISDPEIESMLNSDDEPSAICARMKDLCFSRGAEDNLTAVIVNFAGERAAPPAYDPSEDVTMPGIRASMPTAGVTVENNIVGADNAAGMQDSILELDDLTSDELVDVQAAEESHDKEEYLMENEAEVDASVSAAPNQSKAYSFSEKEHADDSSVSAAAKFSPAYSRSQQEEATADPIRPPAVRQRNELNTYSTTPRSSFGVVPMVGLLITGVLAGLAGGYFLFNSPPQPVVEVPPAPIQQSENVPLTSFETTRRLVDEDPVRYLNARAATPQEADDFFWLGRALLLTGKPVEARRQFEEAQARLASFDDRTSAKTIANEISMALAILDSPQATEKFVRDITAANSVNANSNTAVVGATPYR